MDNPQFVFVFMKDQAVKGCSVLHYVETLGPFYLPMSSVSVCHGVKASIFNHLSSLMFSVSVCIYLFYLAFAVNLA